MIVSSVETRGGKKKKKMQQLDSVTFHSIFPFLFSLSVSFSSSFSPPLPTTNLLILHSSLLSTLQFSFHSQQIVFYFSFHSLPLPLSLSLYLFFLFCKWCSSHEILPVLLPHLKGLKEMSECVFTLCLILLSVVQSLVTQIRFVELWIKVREKRRKRERKKWKREGGREVKTEKSRERERKSVGKRNGESDLSCSTSYWMRERESWEKERRKWEKKLRKRESNFLVTSKKLFQQPFTLLVTKALSLSLSSFSFSPSSFSSSFLSLTITILHHPVTCLDHFTHFLSPFSLIPHLTLSHPLFDFLSLKKIFLPSRLTLP